ncbi:MAG: hypothetical protein U9R15_08730, partial [Chloroflexota bacterium]|nr:hypothetical protein [Chloroflexota bacterium]
MVTVIHDVNRKGTGWYILGDRFTSCGRSYTKAHNKGISEGTTTEPSLLSVLSTCYMTTDAWDSLPQDVKIEVKNRVTGIVGSDFARLYTKTTDEGRFYCRAFIPDSIIEGYKEESIIVCTEGEKR